MYTTYAFGESYRSVRIILLDCRYSKTSYFSEDSDVLGKAQWEWLEGVFQEATETFILIGSGTQILPIDRIITEAWYPSSREKLFNLIGKYKKSGVLLLTGDVHQGQILKTFCVHSSKNHYY